MQSFVITAYKDSGYLSRLVNSIADMGDGVYVHIDAKSDMKAVDLHLLKPKKSIFIINIK